MTWRNSFEFGGYVATSGRFRALVWVPYPLARARRWSWNVMLSQRRAGEAAWRSVVASGSAATKAKAQECAEAMVATLRRS